MSQIILENNMQSEEVHDYPEAYIENEIRNKLQIVYPPKYWKILCVEFSEDQNYKDENPNEDGEEDEGEDKR